jgi:hypothetical protein
MFYHVLPSQAETFLEHILKNGTEYLYVFPNDPKHGGMEAELLNAQNSRAPSPDDTALFETLERIYYDLPQSDEIKIKFKIWLFERNLHNCQQAVNHIHQMINKRKFCDSFD